MGDNIMGDMHVVATYSGWKDFGGAHGADEGRADARRMAVLRGRHHGGEGQSRLTSPTLVPAPAPPAGRGGAASGRRCRAAAAAPALTVTAEKLGDGLYRLTTGAGSYDSLIIEFKDHVMMLEAGQNEARALAYIAEDEEAVSEQADPLRHEHPPTRRSHWRAARDGGRGRHDRHAEEQRGRSSSAD